MLDETTLAYIAIASLAYLMGSIPFGIILGPVFKVGDIRGIGSGNIGATNALRTGKKSFAIAVLLGDAGKAVVAILLARYLFADTYPHAAIVAALAAMIGHVFPVWLKFKGGKGVATSAGILLTLHWPTGLCCLALWLLTARLSRISSLAALLASIHAPIYAAATDAHEYALPFAVLTLIIWFTHRDNIKRLLKGEESSIKLK